MPPDLELGVAFGDLALYPLYPFSIRATSTAGTIIARIIQFWNVKPRSVKCCTSQSPPLTLPTSYLMSAGPRQPCVWGSRTRPLPQPPTRSFAVTFGTEGSGIDGIPAFITCGSGLRNDPAAWQGDQTVAENAVTKTRRWTWRMARCGIYPLADTHLTNYRFSPRIPSPSSGSNCAVAVAVGIHGGAGGKEMPRSGGEPKRGKQRRTHARLLRHSVLAPSHL
jgi:hypothetical protein